MLSKSFKQNWFFVSALLIVFLSFFLKFYRYWDRFGLAYDQAHNAIIARYAVENRIIPLLGPFSSGGPFQTSGIWYWFVMLGTVLYPKSLIAPWVFLTLIYILFVVLIMLFAKNIVDKKFAVIVGLITAVSTAQIQQGINLTNQSPQAILSLTAIWFGRLYIKSKNNLHLFLTSLSIGMAASIHLEGVALTPIVIISFLISRIEEIRKRRFSKFVLDALKGSIVVLPGILIPWTPVFIAESKNNFFNTTSMLNYYSSEQGKVPFEVLGRRWLTFITEFIPQEWALITGGFALLAYIIILILTVIVINLFRKIYIRKKTYSTWLFLILSFLPMLAILRYTRTPLFSSYLVFLHPFILLFTGWVIYFCWQRSKFIGIILLLSIIGGSLFFDYQSIKQSKNNAYLRSDLWRNVLYEKYPNQKFVVYDYQLSNRSATLTFVLLLQVDNMVSDHGRKVGVFQGDYSGSREVLFKDMKYYYSLINLEEKDKGEIDDWGLMNPKATFDRTEYWYKNN